MFKYVWIIMLIILGLLLIGYTAWCVYDEYRCCVMYCERYEMPMDNRFTYHMFLLSTWFVIILSILVALFLSSLGAYCQKPE